MNNQTVNSDYTIQYSSNVTITVLSSNGTTVKTLQTSTQEEGCLETDYDSCVYGLNWDGTNDEGGIVAPGQYTVQVTAANSVGSQSITELVDVANPGVPGALENPAPDSTLEGLVYFEFDPSSSFPWGSQVTQIDACLSTGPCAPMYNTSPDGDWWTTELMTGLTAGEATLTTTVYFTDPLGAGQSWTDSGRTVFVNTQAVPPPDTVWAHETSANPSMNCGTNPTYCMAAQTPLSLKTESKGNLTIKVSEEHQTIAGFGAMLTDSAAVELTSLPTSELNEVMSNLFDRGGRRWNLRPSHSHRAERLLTERVQLSKLRGVSVQFVRRSRRTTNPSNFEPRQADQSQPCDHRFPVDRTSLDED